MFVGSATVVLVLRCNYEKEVKNTHGKTFLIRYIQLDSAENSLSFVWILDVSRKRTLCLLWWNLRTVHAPILSESSHNIYSQKFVIQKWRSICLHSRFQVNRFPLILSAKYYCVEGKREIEGVSSNPWGLQHLFCSFCYCKIYFDILG